MKRRLASWFERSSLYALLLHWWGRLPLPKFLRWIILWLGVDKFLVGVGAVVVNQRGEVLLFRHTYRPDYPWGLPGGWLKGSEDPVQALAREIYEESRLMIKTVRPLHVGIGPVYPQLEVVFLARYEGGTFRPSPEVSEARFFPADNLPPTYQETRAVIQQAVAAWEKEQ